MAEKYLIVVDMQKDFTYGALKNEEAIRIIPNVVRKVREFPGKVIFTYDTHREDYLNTQEGKNLPVPHCIRGTEGWELVDELQQLKDETKAQIFEKPAFGSVELAEKLREIHQTAPIGEIVLVGICTDICVISNAMLLKAFLPEVPVSVDASCCAGVTPESHQTALNAMKACQIQVTGQ